MNSIKIAISAKKKFAEFYDTRVYRKQPSGQFAVKQYKTSNQKIIIDEEK